MSFASAISTAAKTRFWQWVSRRSPKSQRVILRHKSIYVLPTRQGLIFLVFMLAMWILGTNYENNLILGTTFLLLSVMIVSILHTYRNLSGLQFHAVSTRPGFVGERVEFHFSVSGGSAHAFENIYVSLNGEAKSVFDLVEQREHHFTLTLPCRRRGWLEPGRMLVESSYPFGLMRAWSWVELDTRALVYPAPHANEIPPTAAKSEHQGTLVTRDNPEDFYGLAVYREGASLSQVAWKHYARGAGLHLKEYVGYQSQDIWLDWHGLTGLDTEARLSRLCFWVLQLAKTNNLFGLRLPHQTIELGAGVQQQEKLLRVLALYDDRLGAVSENRHA